MSFEENFRNPDKKYSVNNLWFFNHILKPEKLRWQIREMVDKGVYNGFMHARAFLKTPYLEQEWWDAIDACIDESEKVGFFPWLYDEYAWPSGTAGSTFEYSYQKPSRVLACSKDFVAKSVFCEEWDIQTIDELKHMLSLKDEKLLGIYRIHNQKVERYHTPEAVPVPEHLMVFFVRENPVNVDYLNPDVIAQFLRFTHEEYKKRYGKHFGKLIPGIFFDEIYMQTQPLPWTSKLPDVFMEMHGYDIMDFLPWLMVDGNNEAQKVRENYYKVTSYLYEKTFFEQISKWCEANGLMLTGHTEEYLDRHPARQGSYFDTMRHLHIPGADNHDYRYRFPRKITYCESKYAVSVSRVHGYELAMSEAMGGAGWGCSLQTFKRGINTMAALGINMFTLHGLYYSCEHKGSQGDWPTSLFYQNPYWKYFKLFADYVRRVSYMNAIGMPKVNIGLFYPVEEITKHAIAGYMNDEGQALVDAFHHILNKLIENQIDVDYIDKANLKKATLKKNRLCVGKEAFSVLIFPDTLVWDASLEALLAKFEKAGGKVLFYKAGTNTAFPESFRDTVSFDAAQLCDEIMQNTDLDIIIEHGQRYDFFANHRMIEGKDVYFLTNSCPEEREYTILLKGVGALKVLDPENGENYTIPYETIGEYTRVCIKFKEDQALFIVIGADCEAKSQQPTVRYQYSVSGKWGFLPAYNSDAPIDKWRDGKSDLYIPICTFAYGEKRKLIRICNTEWEKGYCGRHLSNWDASVITRRTAWKDDSSEKDLYFRKIVSLDEQPQQAKICIAAVNEYELFINGKLVHKAYSGACPETIDICQFLTCGNNLIAVHVHNEKCLARGDLNGIDYLPKDRLISLILEGEIQTLDKTITFKSDESFIVCNRLHDNWNKLEANYELEAQKLNHTGSAVSFNPNLIGKWVNAWSRGELPLHPWGDLPLFGESVKYPKEIAYTVTLPAGSRILYKPVVQGQCRYLLDSLPIEWNDDIYELPLDSQTHILSIQMQANFAEDGLQQPVRVTVEPFETSLNDWRLFGLNWFSGDGIYRIKTNVQKQSGRYILNLGKVCFSADVFVNNQRVGARVWAPYEYDVTNQLVNGENELIVCVSNSAAVERQFMLVDEGRALGWDSYWNSDNIHREGENLTSGLLGPVMLERYYTDDERRNIL